MGGNHKYLVFQAPGIVGVRDALLDRLTFKLGEYNADIQHGPPHRGRSVELLRGRYKFHIVLLKQLHHIRKFQNRAADPVQLVHDNAPYFTFADLSLQTLFDLFPALFLLLWGEDRREIFQHNGFPLKYDGLCFSFISDSLCHWKPPFQRSRRAPSVFGSFTDTPAGHRLSAP